MPTADTAPLPDAAFLNDYEVSGHYTDCFVRTIERDVALDELILAFYTTPVFKLERAILTLAGHSSSDSAAAALAEGESDTFAAWSVESRAADQILLAAGRTRSWLMVLPVADKTPAATHLYFGSAIVRDQRGELGKSFSALLGFHTVYSRILLNAAARRIAQR